MLKTITISNFPSYKQKDFATSLYLITVQIKPSSVPGSKSVLSSFKQIPLHVDRLSLGLS